MSNTNLLTSKKALVLASLSLLLIAVIVAVRHTQSADAESSPENANCVVHDSGGAGLDWLGRPETQSGTQVVNSVLTEQFGDADEWLKGGLIGVVTDHNSQELRVVIDTSLVDRTALEEALRERLANDETADISVAVTSSCHPSPDLQEAEQYVSSEAWKANEEAETYSYSIDAATSQIAVELPPGSELSEKALSERLGDLGYVKTGGYYIAGRDEDAEPHKGGAGIRHTFDNGNVCTSAFTAVGPGGNKGSLTAGHCFSNDQTVRSGGTGYGEATGESNYPTFDLIRIRSAGEDFTRQVYGTRGSPTLRDVLDAGNPSIGELVCTSGMLTGQVCDIEVINLDASGCTGAGCTVNLAKARKNDDTVARPGDSGGPVYVRDGNNARIRGMITGLNPEFTSVYFHKVNTIKDHLDVDSIGQP